MRNYIKRTDSLKKRVTKMRLRDNMSFEAIARETSFSSTFIRDYCIENYIGFTPNYMKEKKEEKPVIRSLKYREILEEPVTFGKSYAQILKEKGLKINNEGYATKIKKKGV
jgi:hypothetical protein